MEELIKYVLDEEFYELYNLEILEKLLINADYKNNNNEIVCETYVFYCSEVLEDRYSKYKSPIIYKDKIKKLIKQARAFVAEKKMVDAKNLLPEIYSALDRAAKVGVIKKNNASRKKSRLTKLIDIKK